MTAGGGYPRPLYHKHCRSFHRSSKQLGYSLYIIIYLLTYLFVGIQLILRLIQVKKQNFV